MAAESPEDPGYRINDPEELSQTKRISELLARRKAVIDARDEAFDVHLLGQASEEQALAYYRSRIESLILDLHTKFKNTQIQSGKKYLETEKIDTVYVPPPDDIQPDGGVSMAPGAKVPDPEPVHIRGLQWFIENGQTVSATFTVPLWDPPGEHTVTNEVVVPRTTLDKALTKCIEFMDIAGIDADISDRGEDIIRDFDASGDEVEAGYGTAEYQGDPEI